MLGKIGRETPSEKLNLEEDIQDELLRIEQDLEEINRKLQQSQMEVDKLSQRNVSITSRLRKIRNENTDISREEIREVYDEALDAQQRLFVMRGQMEKMQSEQVHLQNYRNQLMGLKGKLQKIREEKKDSKEPSALELIESVIQAQEAERQRLSRKMHDGPAQALSNFILQAEIAQRLFDRDIDQAREELEVLKDTASATFQKVRDFIFELRPMMLDDLGLVPTLRHYVEAYQEQIDPEIEFSATGTERRLERYLEVMIFRAIQELLSNASRHSQAARIRIQLDTSEHSVRATVEDNGRGFNLENVLDSSMGIKVIKDRVDMLGGEMAIDTAEDQGTRISFEVPAGMVGGDVFA